MNSITKLLFVFALNLISVSALCFQNEPDNFRGIKWGSDFENLTDMIIFQDHGESKFYKRNNDNLKIGEASVQKIVYGFDKNQFRTVLIEFSELTNFSLIKKNLFQLYGPIPQTVKNTEDYLWIGKFVSVHLRYNELTKEGGIAYLYNTPKSNTPKAFSMQKKVFGRFEFFGKWSLNTNKDSMTDEVTKYISTSGSFSSKDYIYFYIGNDNCIVMKLKTENFLNSNVKPLLRVDSYEAKTIGTIIDKTTNSVTWFEGNCGSVLKSKLIKECLKGGFLKVQYRKLPDGIGEATFELYGFKPAYSWLTGIDEDKLIDMAFSD